MGGAYPGEVRLDVGGQRSSREEVGPDLGEAGPTLKALDQVV